MATLEGIRDVVAIVRDLLLIVFLIGGIIFMVQMIALAATLGTTLGQVQSMFTGAAPSGAGPLGPGGLGGFLGTGTSGGNVSGPPGEGAKCSMSPQMLILGRQAQQAFLAGDTATADQKLRQLEPLVASSCAGALPSLQGLRQALRDNDQAGVEKYAGELFSYFSG